jgi:hypothetical protein
MPKTPPHINNCLILFENYIRLTRKSPAVQTKSEAVVVQKFSNDNLRSGMFTLDLAHIKTPGLYGMNICHLLNVYSRGIEQPHDEGNLTEIAKKHSCKFNIHF